MSFQIGDKVVYPNQGVGTVENINFRSFGSQQFEKVYLLRLVYGSMTVMVPFSNVGTIGLRKVTRNAEIERVIALCRDIVARWSIAPYHVLAHSDIAPNRKRDPGEAFPWRRLAPVLLCSPSRQSSSDDQGARAKKS